MSLSQEAPCGGASGRASLPGNLKDEACERYADAL